MTSSSSPGISLKREGISYMAGSDLPAVIINVQRGGPAWAASSPPRRTTGRLPRPPATATSRFWCLPPSTVQEMVDLISHAFDTGRQVPHARHDPGRRHAGPDDGAGGAAERVPRSCPKTLGCQRPRRQARPQHHQLSVPDP